MRVLTLLATMFLLSVAPAQASVVVVWSPGVEAFDPYDPGYTPAPRSNYVWIPGYWDEFGYFVPGYWQPVQTYPGYVWVAGFWSGRTYHEGYWRPAAQSGRVWIDGYYLQGRYVSPRWVPQDRAEAARAQNHARAAAQPPPQHHEADRSSSHAPPADRSGDDRGGRDDKSGRGDKKKSKR